jgi:hypothetical protein
VKPRFDLFQGQDSAPAEVEVMPDFSDEIGDIGFEGHDYRVTYAAGICATILLSLIRFLREY